MAQPTNYFVDPVSGTDDVAGDRGSVIGNPWASNQYALDHITRNAASGDQINNKEVASDDTLGAALNITGTYGVPTEAGQLTFRGYDTAVNDDGMGGIDGGGNTIIGVGGVYQDYVNVIDMHCHDVGANTALYIDRGTVAQCFIETGTSWGIRLNQFARAINNRVETSTGILLASAFCVADSNYLKTVGNGISFWNYSNQVIRNIISVGASGNGILADPDHVTIMNNTILGAASNGKGILLDGGFFGSCVANNLVEGFSNGGKGIEYENVPGDLHAFIGHNAVYDCATKYSGIGGGAGDARFALNAGDNEELTVSPLMEIGANSYANRFAFFEPSDAGNIRGGAYPSGCRLDKGAVQHIHRKRRLQMRVIA